MNQSWDPGPARPRLPLEEVHVWRVALEFPRTDPAIWLRSLAEEERARAARFHFDHHRRRFILSHGALRAILALYLRCQPGDITFGQGDHGKPLLAVGINADDLRFNLTHSAEGALLGVTRSRDIGIDLEQVRAVPNLDDLARRFFAPGEIGDLLALVDPEKTQAFFRCWTRKEAYIKALGEGLTCPLDRFRVSLKAGEPAQLLEVDGDQARATSWELRELTPWPGYIGCVALRGRGWELRCWEGPV
jgi:4'-phosphopantetheinyl transferase